MKTDDDRILKLENLLSVIKSEIPGTRGSLIINDDGFIIASCLDREPDFKETGLFFSTIIQKIRHFSGKIFNEKELRISLMAKKGDIQLFPLSSSVNLVIISNSDTKPGLLLLRIKKIIDIMNETINSKKK